MRAYWPAPSRQHGALKPLDSADSATRSERAKPSLTDNLRGRAVEAPYPADADMPAFRYSTIRQVVRQPSRLDRAIAAQAPGP